MPRLDRAAASASFTAQIRALVDEGFLRQDEGADFLADLEAQAGRPKGDLVRVHAIDRIGERVLRLYRQKGEAFHVMDVAALLVDVLDIAEHVPGADP